MREETILTFELFTKKILEGLIGIENVEKVDPTIDTRTFVAYKSKNNYFAEYYVDYMVYNLKRREKLGLTQGFYPLEVFTQKRKNVKDEDCRMIREFAMLLVSENEGFVTDSKVRRMRNKISTLYLKKSSLKYFIQYQFLILLQKDRITCFNKKMVEVLEEWVLNSIANLSENGSNDYEVLFALLYICFEIYCCNIHFNAELFSHKFHKFLSNLAIWHSADFWDRALAYGLTFLSTKEHNYFINILKAKPVKSHIKIVFDVYQLCICIAFYFLKIPLNVVLDIFNDLNEKYGHVSQNTIYEYSRALEPRISETYHSKRATASDRQIILKLKTDNIPFVLKRVMKFLDAREDIVVLLRINKELHEKLKNHVYKQLLSLDKISDLKRFRLWRKIASTQDIETMMTRSSRIFPLDDKTRHIIAMDVKRTNFAKFNKESLEKLLVDVACLFPQTTYYQGMNCIGGFLLNYLDDYETAKLVFVYLMRKRLEIYFLNNFARLKKLLYIAERFIQIHVPKLHSYLLELNIGNEFYISPIILTVFTSSLQFIENYSLVSKIIDIFIVEGWVGFFKVLVHVMKLLEKKVLEKDYDQVLEFLNKNIYEFLFLQKLESIKTEIQKVNIVKSDLEKLDLEYNRTRQVVEKYWSDYFERKRKQQTKS